MKITTCPHRVRAVDCHTDRLSTFSAGVRKHVTRRLGRDGRAPAQFFWCVFRACWYRRNELLA